MIKSADSTRVEKPWGWEIRWAVTDRYLGKILHVNRGEALSLQYHQLKDESLYMMSGSIDLDLEDDLGVLQTHRMGPGDSVRIPTGRTHRMTALEEAEIFEVSTPEIDDVIRVEDRYGRHTDSA